MEQIQQFDDNQLVNNVKSNQDNNSLLELINRHSAICNKIIDKFAPTLSNSGVFLPDIYNDKSFIIYKSAETFNIDRDTKFSTWVGHFCRFYCLNHIKKAYPLQCTEDSELESIINDYHINDSSNGVNINPDDKEFILDILSQMNDERVLKIFMLKYFNGDRKCMSFREIGYQVGLSYQGIINIHKQAVKFLKDKMLSKNICDKI